MHNRKFDLVVLVLAHLFLFPVWLLLWCAIPLMIFLNDRGPIFYRQTRVGKDGELFVILKFRTMVRDADRIGPSWNVENDSRITSVGRILRRTALDELPQVLNIWKGEMSLVGPKPLAEIEFQQISKRLEGFERRTEVRPGLTGLAQVRDREDQAERKLAFDLEYIKSRSIWLDVKILTWSIMNTFLARWDRRKGKADSNQKP